MIRLFGLLFLATSTVVLGVERSVNQQQLADLLSSPDTAEVALQTYFEIDELNPVLSGFRYKARCHDHR